MLRGLLRITRLSRRRNSETTRMDSLVIRRAKHETEYVMIRNSALRDVRLSYKARGMLALLLSMPDTWVVKSDWLVKQGTDGRSAVLSGLKELEEAKYLRRQQFRDEAGQWAHDSVIYETPEQPDDSRVSDFQMSGNRTCKEGTTEQILKVLAAAEEKQETCSECVQGWVFDEFNEAHPCPNGCPR